MRQSLIVAEVALAFTLLAGAGLLVRSFLRLLAVDPGFRPEAVLTFETILPGSRYPTAESSRDFYRRLAAQLAAVPGVRAAGAISGLPLGGAENLNYFAVEGSAPVPRVGRRWRSSVRPRPTTSGRWASRSCAGAPSPSATRPDSRKS